MTSTITKKRANTVSLSKFPDPGYADHVAYGRQFGTPSLSSRLKALKVLFPHLVEQTKLLFERGRGPKAKVTPTPADPPLLRELIRDGAIGIRLTPVEIKTIRRDMQPYIAELEARRANLEGERIFKDMLLPVLGEDSPELISFIRSTLEAHGVLETASRYLEKPVRMPNYVKLQISDTNDNHWRDHFTDIGIADPPTSYMHMDSSIRLVKCMLYLNEVTLENGPFSYVIGSNRFQVSSMELVIRKSNDKSRLDKCDPVNRQLFSALPKFLQKKAQFGNDLTDQSQIDAILAMEHKFTSEDGELVLFDNDGIHRGAMAKAGKRYALQIQIEPIPDSNESKSSTNEAAISMTD